MEYRPLVSVGEINIYQHKSNGMYYVSSVRNKSVTRFDATDTQLEMFRMRYPVLYDAFYAMRVEFESNIQQLLFMAYLKILPS